MAMTDLTMSILDGECFDSRRVRLGRSSGTDGMSGERELELHPDHGLGPVGTRNLDDSDALNASTWTASSLDGLTATELDSIWT